MRNFVSLFSTLAGTALLAASAHAEDAPTANVFNADMSNPDLAAVITLFQDVCLPFIAHKTELPQRLNQDHRVKMLAEQGFEFQSREAKHSRVLVEPAREEWKPTSQAIDRGPYGNWTIHTNSSGQVTDSSGQVTVFDGVSSQVVEPKETIVNPTGEINMHPLVPAVYRNIVRDMDIYVPEKDKRQTALLQWNYASNNHPAKSCEIKIEETTISAESFEADFLDKDRDWREVRGKSGTWSQCTIDGADQFRFEATREEGQLSLSVIRNDFFALKMCRSGE